MDGPRKPDKLILSLEDGGQTLTERQLARENALNVTKGEMKEYTETKIDDVSQFYMEQVPQMLQDVLGSALIAYDEAKRLSFMQALEMYESYHEELPVIDPHLREFLLYVFGPAKPPAGDGGSVAGGEPGDAAGPVLEHDASDEIPPAVSEASA